MSAQNTLTKRVADLERSVGAAVMQTICFALVGVDPEKTGPERAIRYPAVGYSSIDGATVWRLREGETLEELRGRIERDRSAATSVVMLVECYECAPRVS